MRFPAALGLWLALTALVSAADPSPLAKVGDYRLLRARSAAAAVAEGNYIYIIGGSDRGEILGDIERFDTRTHTSVRITVDLTPRRFLSAATVDHKLYIYGGWDAGRLSNEPDGHLNIFDLATGKFTLGAPMPTARAHASAVVRGGKIYAIGGEGVVRANMLVHTNITEIYDPTLNTWSTDAAMPTPREAHAVLVGDFILVAGGYNAKSARDEVELFVPSDHGWKTLPPLSRRTSGCSIAFLGEHIFLFGNYGSQSDVLAYHLKSRASHLITPGFKAASNSAAVVHGGKIYVIGGTTDQDNAGLDYIQVFALSAAPTPSPATAK